MSNRCQCLIPVLALAVLGLAESIHAQGGRGRRGPPEAVRTRGGSYFVDVTLPDASDDLTGADRLAATEHVKKAAEEGHLSLLYLFDPEANKKKHERFETTLFNHPNVNVSLKLFKCARVDLTQDDAAESNDEKKAPFFVVFDAKGKCVGEVSMRGYKAASAPLLKLLNRAAKGHGKGQAKLALPAFVKKYRGFLNDLTQHEARKSALESKRARLENQPPVDRTKLAKLEKDEAQLQKAEEKLYESETKILTRARIPPRDEKARRVGERRWGRGR